MQLLGDPSMISPRNPRPPIYRERLTSVATANYHTAHGSAMKSGAEAAIIVLIAAGAVVAAVGTLSSTGLWDIGLGRSWAILGIVMVAAGMVLTEIDIRRSSYMLDDAAMADACRRELGSAPEDGFLVDLYSLAIERPRAAAEKNDPDGEPYLLDLTGAAQ